VGPQITRSEIFMSIMHGWNGQKKQCPQAFAYFWRSSWMAIYLFLA
jgi:hypothetical protein